MKFWSQPIDFIDPPLCNWIFCNIDYNKMFAIFTLTQNKTNGYDRDNRRDDLGKTQLHSENNENRQGIYGVSA